MIRYSGVLQNLKSVSSTDSTHTDFVQFADLCTTPSCVLDEKSSLVAHNRRISPGFRALQFDYSTIPQLFILSFTSSLPYPLSAKQQKIARTLFLTSLIRLSADLRMACG